MKQEVYGAIAPGMTKRLVITIRCPQSGEDALKKVKEEIIIMTKTDHFKVPVEAVVLSAEEFDSRNQENMEKTGQALGNSRVRNRLMSGVAAGRKTSIMDEFKQVLAAEEQAKKGQQLQNKNDTSKLSGVQEDQYGDMDN